MTEETASAQAGDESGPLSKTDSMIKDIAASEQPESPPEEAKDQEKPKELTPEEKATQAEKQRERQRQRADRNLFKYERERTAKQKAEKRLSEIRAAQAELEKKGAPKLSDFEGKPYEEYLDAITEWKIERKGIENQRQAVEKEAKAAEDSLTAIEQEDYQELQQAAHENIEQARKTFPDMDEVTKKYGQTPIPENIWRCFQNAENPGYALYSVMKEGALEEICAMNPYQAAMAIARHEDKALALSKPKTVSDAPAPRSSPGGGGASGGKPLDKMSAKELVALVR